MARCKAKARSTGKQCKRHAVGGYTVCQVHGAGSPKKGRPGGYKSTDEYSRRLPKDLRQDFERVRADSELVNLRDDMALIRLRILGLIEQLETGGGEKDWKNAQLYYDNLVAAISTQDEVALAAAIRSLGTTLRNANDSLHVWNEIRDLMTQQKFLAEYELKRATAQHRVITVERLFVLIDRIVEVVTSHVSSQTTLRQIENGIGLLLDESS